jgi:hypothetical protein
MAGEQHGRRVGFLRHEVEHPEVPEAVRGDRVAEGEDVAVLVVHVAAREVDPPSRGRPVRA